MKSPTLLRFFTNVSLSVTLLCVRYSMAQNLVPVLEKTSFSGKDITPSVFGSHNQEIFPVTYADFNSDKITDIFALSRDQSSLFIFFGQENPSPLFKPEIQCNLQENWEFLGFSGENSPVKIIGVTAADFNGDSILDVMITYERYSEQVNKDNTKTNRTEIEVVIFRGNLTKLDCDVLVEEVDVIMHLVQEPLVLDINGDMIMDLFGEVWVTDHNDTAVVKKIWIFEPAPGVDGSPLKPPSSNDFILSPDSAKDDNFTEHCMIPHGNAFADIDGDLVPELVLVTATHHHHHNTSTYHYQRKTYKVEFKNLDSSPTFRLLEKPLTISAPPIIEHPQVLGQSIFLDLNQDGTLVHLLPFSSTLDCRKANGILVVAENRTSVLPIQFTDNTGSIWTFPCKKTKHDIPSNNIHSNYTDQTIVLRAGDFNLDGFPDLIGILRPPGNGDMNSRAVLFENIPCVASGGVACPYPRTFRINYDALAHYHNVTLATFFDLHENGLVDVILVRRTNADITARYEDTYSIFAFANSPDYDANFMKVMVLSGLSCPLCPKSKTPYGNILSGPVIKYMTTTQSGQYKTAVASQNYRSSHMALDIPYTIFGIGQSPNFIETLEISVSSDPNNIRTQQWTQIIPNSQILIIPSPLNRPWEWKAKLFLTPSRAVLSTGLVLIGFFTIISLIIGALHFKERRDDMKERLEEAHRFHMM